MLRKFFKFSAITFVLAILILVFWAPNLPKTVPIPLVKYNNLEIKTVPALYNWFDKGKGGNSYMGLPPEEGVKDVQSVIVEPNEKICFSFDTLLEPRNISLNLWKNGEIVSKKTFKKTKEGLFYVPNEIGIYVYEINAEWDETHTSSFSFKIEVK